MNINGLTPEQKAKAMACTSSKELIALADEYGIELTDEQLDEIAGGGAWGFDYEIW